MYKTFVSFDWDNDKHYKFLLNAMSKNASFNLSFDDRSSQEIKSNDVGRVKAALTRKISEAYYTLVIVGQHANQRHKDWREIGYENWQNLEIARSKDAGNKLIAVKLDRNFTSPAGLLNAGASWAMAYTEEAILRAFRGA